jgi:hypothetical protein
VRLSAAGEGGSKVIPNHPQALFTEKTQFFKINWKIKQNQNVKRKEKAGRRSNFIVSRP